MVCARCATRWPASETPECKPLGEVLAVRREKYYREGGLPTLRERAAEMLKSPSPEARECIEPLVPLHEALNNLFYTSNSSVGQMEILVTAYLLGKASK